MGEAESVEMNRRQSVRPAVWMGGTLLLGGALLLGLLQIGLYPDADQLDSGYHYLFARWAWTHPEYLLSVWARPLFTLSYSFAAQWGYIGARVFTLGICLLTAQQTWRLARRLGLPSPEMVIPLLFLQPAFWELSTGVYTEPLFALLFVIALRLRAEGRDFAAILTVSLLILVRPEGFFIGVLWGAWETSAGFLARMKEAGRGMIPWKKLGQSLFLALGMAIWWGVAWLMTGDGLWIPHNWPPDWNPSSQANGTGPLWWYVLLLPMIIGPFFLPSFIAGMIALWRQRCFTLGVSAFLTIFIVHSVLFSRGWFGAAGYARYFVCVAPATAVIALAGWQWLSTFLPGRRRAIALIASLIFCLGFTDLLRHGRDARAIDEIHADFTRVQSATPGSFPVTRLVNSQPYMRIAFDRDHWEMPGLSGDRRQNIEMIGGLASGTLVFWDQETGPDWYHLTARDFTDAGFELMVSREYRLPGRIFGRLRYYPFDARRQTFYILYKR